MAAYGWRLIRKVKIYLCNLEDASKRLRGLKIIKVLKMRIVVKRCILIGMMRITTHFVNIEN
jgi:hypothetical protein